MKVLKKLIVSKFEAIADFIAKSKELVNVRDAKFKAQAIEFAGLNPDYHDSKGQYVSIRDAVKKALLESPVGIELKAHDKKYAMTYAGHMSNAMIAIFNGLEAEYLEKTDIKVLSEDGLKVLETSGKSGGFEHDYKLHPARKPKLIKAGINPDTGLPMSEAEKAQYKADDKASEADTLQQEADDKASEAEKEARQDTALAALQLARPEHRQAVKFLRIRIDAATTEGNPNSAKDCKVMLDEYRLMLAETLGFMPTVED